jgi:hypothetical protein
VFFYLATFGVLCLLVRYVITNVAAAWHLGRRSPWQSLPPAAGALVAGFVLYHNLWPVPPGPYDYFPAWCSGGWPPALS